MQPSLLTSVQQTSHTSLPLSAQGGYSLLMAEPPACAPSVSCTALDVCEDNKPSSDGGAVSKMRSLSMELGTWVIGLWSHLQRRELGTPKWGRISSRCQGSERGDSLCLGREVAVLLRSHRGLVAFLYPWAPTEIALFLI